MPAFTSIMLGISAAAATAGAVNANEGRIEAKNSAKAQRREIERQRKEEEKQQSDTKKKIAAEKVLSSRRKGAEEDLATSKLRQDKRKKSAGREGTILTDGPVAAGPGADPNQLLGGTGQGKQKSLLGL